VINLHSISLIQFKNYLNRSFDFTERIVAIYGKNGVGKTNLLDAIHYLCFTKSYFTRTDAVNVKQGNAGFRIEGNFTHVGESESAACIFRETGKKEFSVNGTAYEKFSRHIGRYPCVVVAPDDIQIITGPAEERRRFLDALLSQINPAYLQHLINYNKILQQRNSCLRSFAEQAKKDMSLLDVLDEQLAEPADQLFRIRKEFLVSFLPAVKQLYNTIARQYEDLSLFYDSEMLSASAAELLKANRQKDLLAERTTSGTHRDDLDIKMGSQPFKSIASQGQRKSLLFALKVAEMDILEESKGFPPLLLLDDIFEKLDEERIAGLLQRVCVENKGQVFITDTNESRLVAHLDAVSLPFQLIGL